MRDVNRIAPFMDKVAVLWQQYCSDWRFGQLLCNFERWYRGDIFYLEEEKFLCKLEEFLKETCGNAEVTNGRKS